MQSLRTKLALSHTLHVVILMPLLSLYLLYSLDEFLTQTLLHQLTNQARLLDAQLQRDDGAALDAKRAQDFLNSVGLLTDARVLILSQDGVILASTRSEDKDRIGTVLTDTAVKQALSGAAVQGVGPGLITEVAYVVLPLPPLEHPPGALRLSYAITDVRAQFNQLQLLVGGGVIFAMVLGLMLGVGLATTITRPLRRLRESAQQIAQGNLQARASVRGHDEVGAVARTFNEMAVRLEQADIARQRQLAAITHELARPLTGMRAAVETLRESDGDAESGELLLEGVAAEIERLQRLITTLQGLQKRTVRPLKLTLSDVSLERVIRGSLANYESLAGQRGVSLTWELPRELLTLHADEDRLIQVLTNLLDNSMKFTPRGGSIDVTAVAQDDFVRVSVADTGEGIDAEELPHIFQQFYQGSASHAPESLGMGLGLAISQEIIAAHGGRIWAESKPGESTRISFTIPKG